jgi:hypothetical protein
VPLLSATTASASPKALASSSGTEVYLKLSAASSGAAGSYYPVTAVHLSSGPAEAGLKLSFDTSSLVLLNDILHAAAKGGQVPHVTLAFRALGLGGRLTTESVSSFPSASVTAFSEQLSGAARGTVSLRLTSAGTVISAPAALERLGPFAATSAAPAARAYASGPGSASPAGLSAVRISQQKPGDPLRLSFTTSSVPLLDELFRSQGSAAGVADLQLAVAAGKGAAALNYTFAALRVGSFAEDTVTGALSGTATLLTPQQ